jgi:hypothetical protein
MLTHGRIVSGPHSARSLLWGVSVDGRKRGIGTLPRLIVWRCYSTSERAPNKNRAGRQAYRSAATPNAIADRLAVGLRIITNHAL